MTPLAVRVAPPSNSPTTTTARPRTRVAAITSSVIGPLRGKLGNEDAAAVEMRLAFDAVLVACLIAILVIDLEHYIIPDELSIALVATGIGRDVYGRLADGYWSHALRVPVPSTGYELVVPASLAGQR